MTSSKVWLIAVGTLILVAGARSVSAQSTTTIPPEHPSLMKGVRPLGMGNAFIAMPAQDDNAMFYNPAAINDYPKELNFRVISPVIDFSPSVIGLVFDILDLADAIDAEDTDAGKIREFRDFVNDHTGEFESVSVRLPVVTVMHKYFAASVLADSRSTISFRNRAATNVEISSRSDVGGAFGGAYGFFDEQLQVGLALKVLHRISINETVTTDDIINSADFSDTLPLERATGVGVDLGLKGTIPTFDKKILEFLKPTVGFTWQDIGNTRFADPVPDTLQSIGVGLALHPTWKDWKFHFANDFREMNQDVTFWRMWNVGVEAEAPKLWGFFVPSVRLGAQQGYIAAGTGLDFKYAKLEFATYADEVGFATRQKGLRRIATNLSFGF